MANIKFLSGEAIPLEMHKVRTVQKLNLPPVETRRQLMEEAGNNTFLLRNRDVFLDMLTDSGVNAMSDRQQAAMTVCDDAYAGSESFYRLEATLQGIFGTEFFLPAHQGRAAENILACRFVTPGSVAVMNYHFTTTKAHITRLGGRVEEIVGDEGLALTSDAPFKGNADLAKLRAVIDREGAEHIAFVRMEAGTNLIGGQPFSLENACAVTKIAREAGILTILDASLLQDNLYFMKTREESCRNMSIRDITRVLAQQFDIIYFSARKFGFARGGGICTGNRALYESMMEYIPLYEGFLTYGGMSVREMEAINVGLEETMDMDYICQGPQFIQYMTDALIKNGVPVVTPAGGLGCHLDARRFLPHLPQTAYPAGALAAAVYIAGGIRGMERGTLSEQREADGTEHLAACELVRLALPRRVYTLSQVKYAIDRITWLHENRSLVGGLSWVSEPETLRFFFGRLRAEGDWQERLAERFRKDFGESL